MGPRQGSVSETDKQHKLHLSGCVAQKPHRDANYHAISCHVSQTDKAEGGTLGLQQRPARHLVNQPPF